MIKPTGFVPSFVRFGQITPLKMYANRESIVKLRPATILGLKKLKLPELMTSPAIWSRCACVTQTEATRLLIICHVLSSGRSWGRASNGKIGVFVEFRPCWTCRYPFRVPKRLEYKILK